MADQIFGTGTPCRRRAPVDEVSQGQTQLVALVPDFEKRTDRFVPVGPSASLRTGLTLSEDGLSLTCPNGVTTTQVILPG